MPKWTWSGLTLIALAACSTVDSSPLIFGQGLTVGISVGASPTNNATPEITLGVKQANLAIVPTVIPGEVPLPANEFATRRIAAFGAGEGESKGIEDALSTFGSFSNNTSVNGVTLGVFFATGVAAQRLSEGFRCAVSKNSVSDCVAKPPAAAGTQ